MSDATTIDWPDVLSRNDRWLRMVVYARVGDAGAVDEVMQEVALAAVRQSSPIQDVTKVGPWLYRLAIRQSLLFRRKIGRQRKLTDRYAQAFQPSESDCRQPGPLSWLLRDERRQQVRTAMGQLKRKDAEILLLKYTENWNYHQIAARLGISHSAVEARLHRARQRLRDALAALENREHTHE
ncbi:MAG: RNA polymerase sigma factor [Pirellulaceae bacterium]|nr:RNA polymerase sigma factor [Planctomycetales bacterium]